jgi:hypothetical protein
MNRRAFLAAAGLTTTAGCSLIPGGEIGPGDSSFSNTTTPGEDSLNIPQYDVDRVRSDAETVSYEELFRNLEEYQGESVHYPYVRVYQTAYEDDFDYLQAYVSTRSGEWPGDVAMYWFGGERLLENDRLEAWAVVEKLHTYETVEGAERTIPLLTLVDFRLKE